MPILDFAGFDITDIQRTGTNIVVTLKRSARFGECHHCGQISNRVHSKYHRSLSDLPIQGCDVTVYVQVRRFRCLQPTCSWKTFAESLDGFAQQRTQRTNRLTKVLESLVLTTSSYQALRLAANTGIHTSSRTLLRVAAQAQPTVLAPKVLGVDDFAIRRGQTYGTLLYDLQRKRTVDILPGRGKTELERWLQTHPEVEIIVRDRASAYAEAAANGAPQAIQVADRFHLVQNVTNALREVVDGQKWSMPPSSQQTQEPPERSMKSVQSQECLKTASSVRRAERHAEIHRRLDSGESLHSIVRSMGLSRGTVRTYARSAIVPSRAPTYPRARNTDPYLGYLQQRWSEGCQNANQLYQEIVEQGYRGSLSQVKALVSPWRTAFSQDSPTTPEKLGHVQARLKKTENWKELRWGVIAPREHVRKELREPLAAFLALHPELHKAYRLVQTFRALLKEGQVAALDDWLDSAAKSGHAPFQRLARSLTADRKAVAAGIEMTWNSGPIEGQITKLKLIKRIGYGKASLRLLRARMIHSS